MSDNFTDSNRHRDLSKIEKLETKNTHLFTIKLDRMLAEA